MHHAVPRQLPPLEAVLPEIRERRCPQCTGDGIALAGHVIAVAGMIKVEYRCTACRIAFMYVRAALDWAPLSVAAALIPPQEAGPVRGPVVRISARVVDDALRGSLWSEPLQPAPPVS